MLLSEQVAKLWIDGLSGADEQGSAEDYMAECFQEGGKPFVERVKRYGKNEKGKPIQFVPWVEEYLEAIGDWRIPHTLTTGPAQILKTIGHTLLITDTIIEGQFNVAWIYSSRDNRDLNVPEQFKPVVEHWVATKSQLTGKKIGSTKDMRQNARYQVNGVTAIFSYANTSKTTPGREGLASVGGAGASFQANVLFFEERSQWEPGTADKFIPRLNASIVPTKPIRELGTPGAGQGIELELEDADYHFYPHYHCKDCGAVMPLDPKGCLLKEVERVSPSGEVTAAYLSESGRPLEWFHKNEDFAVETAYIGCSVCDVELTNEQRYNAHFRCLKTGVSLRDFIDSLPKGVPPKQYKVGIHLSPLCRMAEYNLAADIIGRGIRTLSTDDWQQQDLGHASETTTGSVTMEMLRAAIVAPRPTGAPDYVMAGIDAGRGEDWLWICAYHLPSAWKNMTVADLIDGATRHVLFGADVVRNAIPGKLKEYGVEYGLIDNEPDRNSASNLCRVSVLDMADQRPGLMDAAKKDKVSDGGIEYPCWWIRNEKFLAQVLHGFVSPAADGHSLYRLPESWKRWEGIVRSERSPLTHLTGPSLDSQSGKWKRGKGNIDDLYYAAMFCEAALYIKLTHLVHRGFRTGTATWG